MVEPFIQGLEQTGEFIYQKQKKKMLERKYAKWDYYLPIQQIFVFFILFKQK